RADDNGVEGTPGGAMYFGSADLRHESLPRREMWTLTTLYPIDVAFVNMQSYNPFEPMPRHPYHHGNLRETLLQGAVRVIAEWGPAAFTLREVARRAGVSHNAPYRHFRDKDALLAAV